MDLFPIAFSGPPFFLSPSFNYVFYMAYFLFSLIGFCLLEDSFWRMIYKSFYPECKEIIYIYKEILYIYIYYNLDVKI